MERNLIIEHNMLQVLEKGDVSSMTHFLIMTPSKNVLRMFLILTKNVPNVPSSALFRGFL